jgi:hypothetical protein
MPEDKKPVHGYKRPEGYDGPHRSDPDFGREQNPATVGQPKEPEPTKPKE